MEKNETASTLTPQQVCAYLLENPEFAEEYFIFNATAPMIQRWFDQRNQGSCQNGHANRRSSLGISLPQQVLHEEESIDECLDPSSFEHLGPRRYSEPVPSSITEKKAAFKLRDMRKKKALTQHRMRCNVSSDLPFSFAYESSKQIEFNKPSLRKTQSAPIYKSMLSRLINSTVYIRRFPSQDTRSKLDLRSSSEDAFLTEIIHDVMRDLNLKSLCHKVIVNVGIITDAEVASLYLIEKVGQKKMLRVLYENLSVLSSCDSREMAGGSGNTLKDIQDDVIGKVAKTGKTVQAKILAEVC